MSEARTILSSEKEQKPYWTIRELRLEDGEQLHELLREVHRATYCNDALGITEEKLTARFDKYTPEERWERLKQRMLHPDSQAYVALDTEDNVIGMAVARIDEDGLRRLGALNVSPAMHGSGLAHELIQKAIDWLGAENDIKLDVATYNDRAKAFYRKWDFEEVPDSESLFDNLIPQITMVRKGERR